MYKIETITHTHTHTYSIKFINERINERNCVEYSSQLKN